MRIKTLQLLMFVLFLAASTACEQTVDPARDQNEQGNPPQEGPETGTLYNGVTLPSPWPPVRSYSTEIRTGMKPYYLEQKPAVIDISVGRQLFVDDFLVAETTLQRVFHYPQYHPANPVLQPDMPWEKSPDGGGFAAPFSDGVWYDEREEKFKLWYLSGCNATCYAESADGIRWEKPLLNLVPGTNIVDQGPERDASTLWLDKEESATAKRYKMFQVAGGKGKWQYHYKTSSDGKTWRDHLSPSKSVADRSTVYRNPFRGVWVWSMRHNVRLRASDPYTIRARDYYEDPRPAEGNRQVQADLKYFWLGPWPQEETHPIYAAQPNGAPGIYNLDATPYESLMLGFFSVWQGPENDVCAAQDVIKRNQVMLGYSRDGYSWHRQDMRPFLPVDESRPGNWNYGNVQSAVGSPLVVGDRLYFYVSGRHLAGGKEVTCTGLATLRRDGFVSMEGSGTLLTPPLRFSGSHCFVNLNVTGELRIALLDAEGRPLDGFSETDCKPLRGDSVQARVEWVRPLSELKGRTLRLRFHLREGALYAFWISPHATGQSQGYTAGGGPGLHASGIDTL